MVKPVRPHEPLASTSPPLPVEVAARCVDQPGLVFFDTTLVPQGRKAHSHLAWSPSLILSGRTPQAWETLREALAARQQPPGEAPPQGFAAGWVEYDGSFCFGFYDFIHTFCHDGENSHWLAPLPPLPQASPAPSATAPLHFRSEIDAALYIERVRRAQEYIAAGDIYQVNLTHRFQTPWSYDAPEAFRFYRLLREASPAPYAAWMALEGRTVLSSSPELFLEITGRTIRTRPIKGTRPRHPSAAADRQSARELVTSPKENAELLMITDLERNDLGRICRYGTVRVPGMMELEAYEQIYHLVSTVEGELRPEIDAIDALRACFPGGSITGAPKKRAMEIIAELETTPRGLYTGAIGYFGYDGSAQFNIAIRTAILEHQLLHFHVGAGIVADSIPEAEWQETLDKAAGLLLAADRFS